MEIQEWMTKGVFKKLLDVCTYDNLTEEEKVEYEAGLKRKRDYQYNAAIEAAREMKKDGLPLAEIANSLNYLLKK